MLRSWGLALETTVSQTLKAGDSAVFSQEKSPLTPMGTFREKVLQEQSFERL